MRTEVRRLAESNEADFAQVMRLGSEDSERCLCTAHYVKDWQTPGVAEACRKRSFEEGKSDGYLLYRDGKPIGWCQAAPAKEFLRFGWNLDPEAWAVTCLVIVPEAKGKGLSHVLMRGVLDDLRSRGVKGVEGWAHRYSEKQDGFFELPEEVCRKAGMTLVRDHPEYPTYSIRFAAQ